VAGATKRERLDDPAFGQGTSNLARPGSFVPGADGQLGPRIELGLDGAQASHNAGDRLGPDWIEQLLPHTPRESAGPAERHAKTITMAGLYGAEQPVEFPPGISGVRTLSH
jgi:hypothetical protein